jgi:hypothetical protein
MRTRVRNRRAAREGARGKAASSRHTQAGSEGRTSQECVRGRVGGAVVARKGEPQLQRVGNAVLRRRGGHAALRAAQRDCTSLLLWKCLPFRGARRSAGATLLQRKLSPRRRSGTAAAAAAFPSAPRAPTHAEMPARR